MGTKLKGNSAVINPDTGYSYADSRGNPANDALTRSYIEKRIQDGIIGTGALKRLKAYFFPGKDDSGNPIPAVESETSQLMLHKYGNKAAGEVKRILDDTEAIRNSSGDPDKGGKQLLYDIENHLWQKGQEWQNSPEGKKTKAQQRQILNSMKKNP